MCDPISGLFGGGGNSQPAAASTSTATAGNTTNVTVQPTTNVGVSIPTADIANAIDALAGAQREQTAASFASSVYAARADAGARVQAAQIAAAPSLSTIIIVAVSILGLAFTAGFIKLPRELRA